MPIFLRSLFLIVTLITLGTTVSYSQSSDCTGDEFLSLFPRPNETDQSFGDTIFFEIEFSAIDNVEFLQLPITYDPLILEYLPLLCSPGPVLTGFTCNDVTEVPNSLGQLRILWFHPNSESDDIFTDDVIVTLAFRIVGIGTNVAPLTIPNSIDGFERTIGNSDPDAPNEELTETDICEVLPQVTFGCTRVESFIQPCGGNMEGTGSINVQVCGGTAPYTYILQDDTGQVISNATLSSDTESVEESNLDPGVSYDLVITDDNGTLIKDTLIAIPMEDQMAAVISYSIPALNGIDGLLCAEGSLSTAKLVADVTPDAPSYTYLWENSRSEVVGTAREAEDLGPGNYFLTVTNLNTGCFTTSDFVINAPEPIVVTIDSIAGPGCTDSDSQGSVSLSVTGGRPEFEALGQYALFFDSPTLSVEERMNTGPDGTLTWPPDRTGFVAGSTWTVFADDFALGLGINCTSEALTFTVPSTTEFVFDIQDNIADCDGFADIAFFVSPSPPNPPFSTTIPNITIFDENGDEVSIVNNSIQRSGDVIRDIPPGDYTFEYMNISDECIGTGAFTVEDGASISVDEASLIPDNPNCGAVGSINIAINGGTGPFDYVWQDGSTDGPIRTDLNVGTEYFVTITDTAPDACGVFMNTDPIEVSGSFSLPTQDQFTSMVDCGATTGTIVFTREAGDMQDYFLQLDDGSPPVNATMIENLPLGTYNVQIGLTDNMGCVSDPIQIILEESSAFDLTNLVIDSVHCGLDLGLIELQGQPSANPPFLMTLTDMAGTVIGENAYFLDVDPGNYNLEIRDTTIQNSCPTEINNITIFEPFEVMQATTADIAQPSCGGTDFGSIEIGVSGGVAPYNFVWDDMQTTDNPIRNDLAPGTTYSVEISDATGTCTEIISDLEVNAVDALNLAVTDLDITDVDCSGALGVIGYTPAATDPNQYIIEVDGIPSMPGESLGNLDIGTYDVLVSVAGSASCNTTVMSVDIATTSDLALDENNVSIVPDCESFQSTLQIDPGAIADPLTIILFQGNTELDRAEGGDLEIENVIFGSYRLNISNGTCDTDINIDIDLDPIEVRDVVETGPACTGSGNDGSIELDLDSGDMDYSLNWEDGAVTTDLLRSDLSAGSYTVTVSNSSGCQTVITDITLSLELTDPFPDIIDEVNASCRAVADGIIEFDNPGGVNEFVWDDGGTGARREDLEGDRGYIITRTVAGNTECSQDFMIEEINTSDDVFVRPEEILTTLAVCVGGTGQVEIPAVAIQNGTAPYTNFQLIGLTGNAENDTILGDDNGLFTDVPAGSFFSLRFADANGCEAIAPVRLEDGDPIVPSDIELISEPICLGDANGSRSIAITGGSTGMFDIEWSSGETDQAVSSSTALELSSGDQFVIVTDNICGADTINFVVAEGDSVTVRMEDTQITDATCFGTADGIIFVNVLGDANDFTFNWEEVPGMNTNRLTDLEAGIYNLTIIDDANECPSSPLEFEVGEPEELVASLNESASVAISCRNPEGTISLDVTGGNGDYTFEWEGFPDITSGTANGLDPGMYQINIEDSNGCPETFATELEAVSNVTFSVSDFDPIRCAGETTLLGVEDVEGGVPPYRYSIIQGGNLIDIDERVEVGAGTYIFNVFDSDGCPSLNTVTEEVTEPDPPMISLGQDTTIDLGEEFRLIPDIFTLVGIDSVNYASSEPIGFLPIGMEGISLLPDRDLNIQATLVDADGCTAMDEVAISVKRSRNVYIPNIFFPTNDPSQIIEARNTIFSVATGVGVEQVNQIQIFDRWGNLFYRGTDIWDGRAPDGQDALPGVYAYLVSVLFTDGQVINYKGDVTLVR